MTARAPRPRTTTTHHHDAPRRTTHHHGPRDFFLEEREGFGFFPANSSTENFVTTLQSHARRTAQPCFVGPRNSRNTSCDAGLSPPAPTAARNSSSDLANTLAAVHDRLPPRSPGLLHLLAQNARLVAGLHFRQLTQKGHLRGPATAHFTRNHHQSGPSSRTDQLQICALSFSWRPPTPHHPCHPCLDVPTRRSTKWKSRSCRSPTVHPRTMEAHLRQSPTIGISRFGCRQVHVSNRDVCSDSPPSRHILAAEQSTAKPRLPKTLLSRKLLGGDHENQVDGHTGSCGRTAAKGDTDVAATTRGKGDDRCERRDMLDTTGAHLLPNLLET